MENKKFFIIIGVILFILNYFNETFAYNINNEKTKYEIDNSIGWEDVMNKEYFIKSSYSGRYLDVTGGNANDCTKVQSYEFNGTDSQRWAIIPNVNEENSIYIVSRLGNKDGKYVYSLDISGGSSDENADVQIYKFNNTNAQTFKMYKNSNLKFVFRAKCSDYDKNISLKDGSYDNGNNVTQKNNNESDDKQFWILEPVERNLNIGKYYALANVESHIKTYPNLEEWGGDCTNYVSQCLLAEGIHMSDNWYIYKKNSIFENPSNTITLRYSWDTGNPAPWINANEFLKYWKDSNKLEKIGAGYPDWVMNNPQSAYDQTKLQIGDVIQLATKSDNNLFTAFHSMFITDIKYKNNIPIYYISEHTNSEANKSLIDICNSNKDKMVIFYKFK